MKIIFNKNKLKKIIQNEKNLGFIPTMGAIHKAHISMVKKCHKICNKSIMSIFINKPQFNKVSDFRKYPRILKKDIQLLKKNSVDYLYLPSAKQIYPNGPSKNIKISKLSKKLCGKFRPGHFEAVVDVIDRFLKIIQPSNIFLGEKDMQQLKVIEDYILKNYIKTKVVSCKTIRENNGVACSSRNALLSPNGKKIASKIYKYISLNKKNLLTKKIFLNQAKNKLLKFGANKIDYIEILNINKLAPPRKKKEKLKIFIAYYINSIRIIDNI